MASSDLHLDREAPAATAPRTRSWTVRPQARFQRGAVLSDIGLGSGLWARVPATSKRQDPPGWLHVGCRSV